MMKPVIAPDPKYLPQIIYHNPYPVQLRLLARTILIYRPTITTEDYLYAFHAVGYAAYWHLDIVTLNKWQGVPGVVRARAKDLGVKVVLCRTLKEALNSSDIKNWKAG